MRCSGSENGGTSQFASRLIGDRELLRRQISHGRDRESFAFVHVGTGIGMGLVLGGRLHRGVHGVAGEIAFMPLSDEESSEARRRGPLEAAAAASGAATRRLNLVR